MYKEAVNRPKRIKEPTTNSGNDTPRQRLHSPGPFAVLGPLDGIGTAQARLLTKQNPEDKLLSK